MLDNISPTTCPFPLKTSRRAETFLALFTVNVLTLVYSRYSIVAYWVAGWMSGNPAQELHQTHLCGCWSPHTPRYSPNTLRSWRRRVSETTLSSSTNCWMSSWTLASHRPQTAKSCRSEWAVGQPQGGPWVEETWRGSGKYPWAYLLISLPPPCQVHHTARQQAGDGQVTSATHCHQCCVLALRGH